MGRDRRRGGWVAGALAVVALLATPLGSAQALPLRAPSEDPSPSPAPAPSASTPAAPAPTESAPTPAAPAPLVMPTSLGSWCTALFPQRKPGAQRAKARAIMAGTVDMGKGGTYKLAERPNWRPQSGTDTSGDRHVHSLDWALPLLYQGVTAQNPAMVQRFRDLLYYWIDDHQTGRGYWVDGSIYGGLRTQTLVCAAQTLNDQKIIDAALRDSQTMIRGFRSNRTAAIGTNNTDLIRQTGALAAYCWVQDPPGIARAWANIEALARGLVHPDGSDVEGSPAYAAYMEALLTDAERAGANCGQSTATVTELRGLLYQFVAQAFRPDFRLTSLGDSVNSGLRDSFGVGDWRADWIRSSGAAGAPPTPVYTTFDGGYVFGRAGWRPQPGGPDTFYSLRFSSSRPDTAHTHDDGGGMTLFSRGVEWIGDPGPYRYDNGSSLRYFMKSRPAHSSFTVSNVPRTKSGNVLKSFANSDWREGGNDTTCLVDRTWGSVTVTRCAVYVRSVDAVIVADYADAKRLPGKRKALRGKPPREVTQRWQLPPGIGALSYENDVLTLGTGDARLDVHKSGPGNWDIKAAGSGSNAGWFTGQWGERLPGAVVSRQAALKPRKSSEVLVTVFVPRTSAEAVPVTIDGNGVTVTRNGTTITTPVPVPA